uniref:Uncharacterized protein n=1 Tax=Kalanchoe fedtschenkoi TaxID=63787 RepID=A0A7N0T227_KALFE
MDTRYEDDSTPQGFEGVENKFLDDVMKLVREQKDAEDAEYARHKEKLDTINLQYQEQLTTLRANHASRRDALLQSESNERQQQYQQAMVDQYSNSNYYSMPSNNPHSYHQGPSASAATKYAHQQEQLNTATTGSNRSRESYKYNQRGHFFAGPGGHHHQDTEPRHSFPGGRIYDNRGFY